MDYLHFILALIVLIFALWAWKLKIEKSELSGELEFIAKERDEYSEFSKGLSQRNRFVAHKKNKAKHKILQLVLAKEKISHKEVAQLVGLSKTSVCRYLSELESEGRIKQVGTTGKSVFYTRYTS